MRLTDDRSQRPFFVSDATGDVSHDPLDLVTGEPTFSLSRLALNFDNPFLEAEFPPDCPWEGVSRYEPSPPQVRTGTSSSAELGERFTAAIRRCIGDADVVAVMYSGGLDSASVLTHAARICRADGRRLIAIVWNLSDQFGMPAGQLAHRQLAAMELDCDLIILPPEWRGLPEPEWSPAGPRLDYYTRLHQAMVSRLLEEKAEVLLTGIGGDEVLGAWQFMTSNLLHARRWKDLWGYELGFVRGDTLVQVAAEAAAMVARVLPKDISFGVYAGVSASAQLRPLAAGILRPEYAEAVREAADRWHARRTELFRERRQSWAEASLFDSIYPLAYAAHPVGSPLYEASPFLDPDFVEYALGLPLCDRFRYSDAPSYHWYKALHFRLLPPAFASVAPRYKQSYSHIFREYHLDTIPDGELACVELGLIRPVDRRDLDRIHPRMPAVVRNIEHWVRGAIARGGRPC